MAQTTLMTALLGAMTVALTACGGGGARSEPRAGSADQPTVDDPGPIHVHGLGSNPKDGALFVATHTGLFRAAANQKQAVRVAGRFQDTMGFTVVGPDRFLGSGHPDGREKLPPFLGLIESRDAGQSWQPVSLLGKRDFHVLEAAGRRIYGFGSDFETREQGLLVSDDGGRSWSARKVPETLISLAVDPDDPDRVVASGQRAVFVSDDAGRRWLPLDAPAGLLAWTDAVTIVDAKGAVHASEHLGRARPQGKVGGQPAALDSGPEGELYVALHDGAIKRSDDGGRSWSLRSTPTSSGNQ